MFRSKKKHAVTSEFSGLFPNVWKMTSFIRPLFDNVSIFLWRLSNSNKVTFLYKCPSRVLLEYFFFSLIAISCLGWKHPWNSQFSLYVKWKVQSARGVNEVLLLLDPLFILCIGLGFFQGLRTSKANSWWCQDSPPDKSAKGRVSVTWKNARQLFGSYKQKLEQGVIFTLYICIEYFTSKWRVIMFLNFHIFLVVLLIFSHAYGSTTKNSICK